MRDHIIGPRSHEDVSPKFYEPVRRPTSAEKKQLVKENKRRERVVNFAYKVITGTSFEENGASDLQYFIYDGILKEAGLGHSKSLKFNLQELKEHSPENLLLVVNQVKKIGVSLKNQDIIEIAEQFIDIKTVKKAVEAKFVDHQWLEEEIKPSFLSQTLKTVFLGTLLISSGLIKFMTDSPAPPSKPSGNITNKQAIPVNSPTVVRDNFAPSVMHDDICQMEDFKALCENNLGIKRIDMPQVPSEALENFTKELHIRNITVIRTSIRSGSLTPVQSEMNTLKILGMVRAAREGKYAPCQDPVLVASENPSKNLHYVIDGHHRYAACRILGGEQTIITAICLTAREALRVLNYIPGVTKAAL